MTLSSAFFASTEVQPREVKLPDGSTHTLHFKELPAVEFRKFQLAENSTDEDVQAASVAKLIALSLVDAEGKPAITAKEAARLKPAATAAIMSAIMDVNGFGAAKNG